MSQTNKSPDGLNFYNCFRLLHKCVQAGLIQLSPRDPNCILVYREAGIKAPEGWYEENMHDCAKELMSDLEGQKFLVETLKCKRESTLVKRRCRWLSGFASKKLHKEGKYL